MIKIWRCSFIFSWFDTKPLNCGIKYTHKIRNLQYVKWPWTSFCCCSILGTREEYQSKHWTWNCNESPVCGTQTFQSRQIISNILFQHHRQRKQCQKEIIGDIHVYKKLGFFSVLWCYKQFLIDLYSNEN